MTDTKLSKTAQKWLTRVKDTSKPFTRPEIVNYISTVLRGSKGNLPEHERELIDESMRDAWPDGIDLTEEHQKQGLDWLWKQHQGKSGKVSINTPFSDREVEILKSFKYIQIEYFLDLNGCNNYTPVYHFVGEEMSFSYCLDWSFNPKTGVRIVG